MTSTLASSRTFFAALVLAGFCILLILPADATAFDLEPLGSLHKLSVQSVSVNGDRLYAVAVHEAPWSVLQVFDITNTEPELLGSVELPSRVHDLRVEGSHAYVAGGGRGVHIVNVSDPTTPVHVSSFLGLANTTRVDVVGSTVFACDWLGMVVADVSDPAHPVVLSTYEDRENNFWAFDIVAEGNLVYLQGLSRRFGAVTQQLSPQSPDNYPTLMIFDVHQPWSPVVLSRLELDLSNLNLRGGIAKTGSTVYLSNCVDAFYVIDVDDPANPEVLNNFTADPFDPVVIGDRLYTFGHSGTSIYGITDPVYPAPHFTHPEFAQDAVGDENLVYLAAYERGVRMLDMAGRPRDVGGYREPFDPAQMAVKDGYVYCTNPSLGKDFWVVDARDPAHPALSDLLPLGDRIGEVKGDRLYLGSTGVHGVQMLDVSDPSSPQVISAGAAALNSEARDIGAEGDFAFAVTRNLFTMSIVNFTDLANPTTRVFSLGAYGNGLDVVDGHAFVAHTTGQFRVVNVSNPGNPFVVGTTQLDREVWDVEVGGQTAYIVRDGAGVLVVDVSDLTDPDHITTIGTPGQASIDLAGDLLYVGDNNGVQVVDIRDPGDPTMIHMEPTSDRVTAVRVEGEFVYVGTTTGFQVYRIDGTPFPEAVSIDIQPGSCPNPLSTKKNGQIPLALLGTPDFDVQQVDVSSLELDGIRVRSSGFADLSAPDGTEPCDCIELGPDGNLDLVLKVSAREILDKLEDATPGDEVPLVLTGALLDGTAIEGTDCVKMVGPPHDPPGKRNRDEFTGLVVDRNEGASRLQLSYQLPAPSSVTLRAYDVRGRLVTTLVRTMQGRGTHSVEWNTGGTASGVYFLHLSAGSHRATMKVVVAH